MITPVAGGKLVREIEETRLIESLGGTQGVQGSLTSNEVLPVGLNPSSARQAAAKALGFRRSTWR